MHSVTASHTKLAIVRNFNRAASTYNEAALLQKEIGVRLLERLDLIQLDPSLILDLGAGTGIISNILAKKFPKAQMLQLDIAESMVAYAKKTRERSQHPHPPFYLCADGEYCPLKNQSIDFIFANCAFHWFLNPQKVLSEIHRILKPGGLLLFSTLGPDTLKELRQSFATIDNKIHVNSFLDMHDIGDMLIQNHFLDPVMDMEKLTITYKKLQELVQDLRLTGEQTVITSNTITSKAKRLNAKNLLHQLEEAYEIYRTEEGVLPATFEVLYGHAFSPLETLLHYPDKDGTVYIPLEHLQRL